MTREAFGIDIGGTGLKGAPVDLDTGKLLAERLKIDTPHPSTPEAVADVVSQIVKHFGWTGPVGATFPAVVKAGVVQTAANVDQAWIGTDAATLFSKSLGGVEVTVVNDADAAGLAEAKWGAAKAHRGVALLLTLGTGIGSALILDGTLVPNTELGHLTIRGKDAEDRASALVRENKELSWKKWAKALDEVLSEYEKILWPDLIVLGGGVSREPEKFIPLLKLRTKVVAAVLQNDAGLVGAALYDEETRLGATPAPTRRGATSPARRATPPRKTAPRKAPPKQAGTATAPTKAAVDTPVKRAPRAAEAAGLVEAPVDPTRPAPTT